ncbi:MAG TPA: YaiO family outer membrane beta-barrel protein [Cyclobacteriaceae bacterium]|jgi:YaiO family outer membrane protein|nr:YaiO family outer membrane beta-barrel protein [Cyclobacteriaceae bacterium]
MILATWCLQARGQEWKHLDVDDLFKLARQTAFDGKRTEAREMLQEVLRRAPTYYEVQVFLARTYAWDGQYEQAKKELAIVLSAQPTDIDALNVLLDTDMWGEKYSDALVTADRALAAHPSNEDFLYKKALILKNLLRPKEAAGQLSRLLELDPSHTKGIALMAELKKQLMKHYVGLSSGFDSFSKIYSSAFSSSVTFGTTHKWGTSIVRLNYADRFSLKGVQPEIEAYPRIANGIYAYVNYGYSNSVLFPKHRVGGEVYTKLPKSFEASLGARYLYFNSETSVVLYTGSIGYYFKNYWVSIRPYLSGDASGTSFSSTATVRYYFTNSDNFLGLNLGYGFSPDERRLQSSSGLSTDAISVLKSQRYGIVWQKTLLANIMLSIYFTETYQELSAYLGNYMWISSGSVMVRKRF